MKFLKYIVLVLLVASSCKSVKNTTTSLKKITAKKLIKKHTATNFKKNTVDAKLKVTYKTSKNNIGVSVRMRMQKDSIIWLKASKLITVFKAKITPSKVQFYSPYYKNYFDGSFAMLEKILGTPINFKQLQSLLLGQAVTNLKQKRHKVNIATASYRLYPKKQEELFDIFFYINPKHYKLNKQQIVSTKTAQNLEVNYPSYTNGFPDKINIYSKSKKENTQILINVRSAKFNSKINTNFKIPKGYKEIQL